MNPRMKTLVKKYTGGYENIEKRRNTIQIFMGGGKKYLRSVGEETEFSIRDILICTKYLRLSDLYTKGKTHNLLKNIHDMFLLSKSHCTCVTSKSGTMFQEKPGK